jgi:uncharacterized membrane protein (DUF441 family)
VIGLVGKNQSIIISICLLLFLRWTGIGQKAFPFLEDHGIQLGVTVITIAILAPIATGQISLLDLWDSMKSPFGVIALFAGFMVAILGGFGIKLLDSDPQVTMALVLGTIVAVTFFKGVAVGPLIGAGIAYFMMKAIEVLT